MRDKISINLHKKETIMAASDVFVRKAAQKHFFD